MARRRYSLFGRTWFHSRWWTKVVPKGTKGAKRGFVSNAPLRGISEIWLRPRRRPVSGAVWHLKKTRGGRGRWT